jgi:hypothetical protein
MLSRLLTYVITPDAGLFYSPTEWESLALELVVEEGL